jgi:hypothetical protein
MGLWDCYYVVGIRTWSLFLKNCFPTSICYFEELISCIQNARKFLLHDVLTFACGKNVRRTSCEEDV